MNEAMEAFKSVCVIIVAVEIIALVWLFAILWVLKARDEMQFKAPSTWPLPADTLNQGKDDGATR